MAAGDFGYDPFLDTNISMQPSDSSTTVMDTAGGAVSDSGSGDNGNLLSGINDLFSTVATAVGSTFTSVTKAQQGPPPPTGYYRTATGTIAPLPAQPVNYNGLLLIGGLVLVAVLVLKS